jgi:CDP-diacylglycerol--glycerol-3-phosphate 3-phosphatidyltransferase
MRMTWANQITILRIILIIPFVLFMLEANNARFGMTARYIALGIFLVMAVSDAVDGYLARVKKQVTHLGTFLDPLADKLLITAACIMLTVKRSAVPGFQMPIEPVILILGKDVLLLLGFITTYFITGHVRIVPVWAGKLSTFLQIVMVVSTLVGPEVVKIVGLWIHWVWICWWATGGIAALATIVYIRHGLRYIEEFEQQSRQKNTTMRR